MRDTSGAFGNMEIIKGTIHNLKQEASEAADGGPGTAPATFELNGRSVWLEPMIPEPPRPLHEGDELIVAGNEQLIISGNIENEALIGLAYRNVTQGHLARASISGDLIYGVGLLVFALACLRLAANVSDISELLWLVRIGSACLGLVLAFFSGILLFSVSRKFHALYLVRLASIEILKGIAHYEEKADSQAAHFPSLLLSGRPVQMTMEVVPAIREGDDVIVAGEPAGDAFAALAFRNVTQSTSGRGWDFFSRIETALLAGIGVAGPVALWLDTTWEFDIWTAIRLIVILSIWTATAVAILKRFYEWKLDREAWRRLQ